MSIQETIEKAIEAGYLGGKSFAKYKSNSGTIVYEEEDYVMPKPTMTVSEALLDPLFWQSLGKAMRWDDDFVKSVAQGIKCGTCRFHGEKPVWKQCWRNFIDHLAEGRTPESFFESLTQ
jgi:hypothetical protein